MSEPLIQKSDAGTTGGLSRLTAREPRRVLPRVDEASSRWECPVARCPVPPGTHPFPRGAPGECTLALLFIVSMFCLLRYCCDATCVAERQCLDLVSLTSKCSTPRMLEGSLFRAAKRPSEMRVSPILWSFCFMVRLHRRRRHRRSSTAVHSHSHHRPHRRRRRLIGPNNPRQVRRCASSPELTCSTDARVPTRRFGKTGYAVPV